MHERHKLEPLGELIAELLADGTIVDFSKATPDTIDAYEAKVEAGIEEQQAHDKRQHLSERRMSLGESGIGRAFFSYPIRPTWFHTSAQNYASRLIGAWQERSEEGRSTNLLLPNIVVTGDRFRGKSSFAVWLCHQTYEHCFVQRDLELVPITIEWITGGMLADTVRRRDEVSKYRRCDLLVVDDVKPISPDWVRREWENIMMTRFYKGSATVMTSRHMCFEDGIAKEEKLITLLPDCLEHMLDRRRGFGEVKFTEDLDKRSRSARVPSQHNRPQQPEDGWWQD